MTQGAPKAVHFEEQCFFEAMTELGGEGTIVHRNDPVTKQM